MCLRDMGIQSECRYLPSKVCFLFGAIRWFYTKIACLTTGTKMPRIDWNLLKKYPVSIPDFQKQKAIAVLLEKWDTAIEKTEALIAAKEKKFKWLLKRLITATSNIILNGGK